MPLFVNVTILLLMIILKAVQINGQMYSRGALSAIPTDLNYTMLTFDDGPQEVTE